MKHPVSLWHGWDEVARRLGAAALTSLGGLSREAFLGGVPIRPAARDIGTGSSR